MCVELVHTYSGLFWNYTNIRINNWDVLQFWIICVCFLNAKFVNTTTVSNNPELYLIVILRLTEDLFTGVSTKICVTELCTRELENFPFTLQRDYLASTLVIRNPKKFSTASTNAPRGDSYRQGISLECYRLKKSKLSAFYERFKPLR